MFIFISATFLFGGLSIRFILLQTKMNKASSHYLLLMDFWPVLYFFFCLDLNPLVYLYECFCLFHWSTICSNMNCLMIVVFVLLWLPVKCHVHCSFIEYLQTSAISTTNPSARCLANLVTFIDSWDTYRSHYPSKYHNFGWIMYILLKTKNYPNSILKNYNNMPIQQSTYL